MKALLISLLSFFAMPLMAQEIAGHIVDKKDKEPIMQANLYLYQNGVLRWNAITDYDGNFIIKPIDPGLYDLVAIFVGYDTVTVQDVIVSPVYRTIQNFQIERSNGRPKNIVNKYKRPLIADYYSRDLHPGEYEPMPSNNVVDIIPAPGGLIQAYRTPSAPTPTNTGTRYIIDGNPVYTSDKVHDSSFAIITSGIPCDGQINTYKFDHTHFTFKREEISQMPLNQIDDLTALLPGAYQPRRGDATQFYGARNTGNTYILDGMHIN